MAKFIPEHLKLWTHPDCYAGPDWSNWYTVVSRHRDSHILDESNFECAAEILETAAKRLGARRCLVKEDGQRMRCIETARDRHWAVGWCEALRVHKDSPASILRAADDIRRRLASYPILDDSDFGQREFDYIRECWESCDVRGRLDYIRTANKHGESISRFAARRPDLPRDDNGGLYQLLSE